jgi:hypothetical protein
MRSHDLARHEEAEPQAGGPVRMAMARVRLEYRRQAIGRDAFTVIADFYFRSPARPADCDVDGRRTWRMFDGIGQDIQEDLLQTRGVGANVDEAVLRG